ncbi:MAG: shikimate dehydrogenase [Desulfobacterales bacterium]|nr:shikimate dehydrogenase [Desulfobacterales bacterium]
MADDAQNFQNPKSAFEIQRKVYCIFGDERVFNSKSPEMFSAVFKQVGLRCVYVPFMSRPEQIADAVASIRALNIAGVNVTVPHKESVIPHIDILSEGAKIIGAVNTIAWDGEALKGYNTNAIGFMDTLEEIGWEVPGKRALVFGSGGAARAVVFILNWLRAEAVYIAARNEVRAMDMADRLGGEAVALEDVSAGPVDVDLIINATSISAEDESSEFAALVADLKLEGCSLLLDLNYGRDINIWEEKAAASGVRFMDGLRPLAYQARRTFALWTGVQVEPNEFLNALEIGG